MILDFLSKNASISIVKIFWKKDLTNEILYLQYFCYTKYIGNFPSIAGIPQTSATRIIGPQMAI